MVLSSFATFSFFGRESECGKGTGRHARRKDNANYMAKIRGAQARRTWAEVWRDEPLALLIATFLGAGFFPFASGTAGSAAGLVAAHLAWLAGGVWALLAFAILAAVLGIWASDRLVKSRGIGDPGEIVIDEVAGQALAYLPVVLLVPQPWLSMRFLAWAFAAFFLFRVIDVWKPGPVGRAEALPGGLGVMADDLLGGAIVGLLLGAVLWGMR